MDIQSPDLGDKRIKGFTHLLLALRFLKKYPTKFDLAGIGDSNEKTALLRVWKYVEAIQVLKEQKVRFALALQVSLFCGLLSSIRSWNDIL